MKNFNLKIIVLLLAALTTNINAQNEENPWKISLGLSAVDFYPVGIHQDGQELHSGDLFNDVYNVQDNWNVPSMANYLSIGKYLKNNFSFALSGSYNSISRYGSERVNDLKYVNINGSLNYSLAELLKLTKFEPFVGVGGGYSWLEEGPFNSNNSGSSSAMNGIGSINGSAGISYWFSDHLGLTYQATYNHVMPDDTNVVQQHFRHSLSVDFRFGGTDTDGDRIYDKNDACPNVAGIAAFSGCPDSDGDGIQDSEDTCPQTAGLSEYSGCPDTDGDGVSDDKDRCPKVAGLSEMAGCPDSDGDGITDQRDTCPNSAGPRGNRGCPWPDTDGDTVVDKDDKCPDEAGTVANNGCPIQKMLTDYAKTINFDYGKSSIRDEATEALQAIAAIIKEYPESNFIIEGHTDSIGSEKFNQILSEQRANSIVDFFVSNGVESSRLSSVGLGESSPIAPGGTKESMAKNRRVEVKLAD
jgi:outer membrane protein OmpA-like peptidoglycan-associated protein/outer membrane protein W